MTLFKGTSVFGVKYKDGVVFAADTLGSYGSLARYPDIERVIKVNDNTVVACSGDIADFQVGRKGKIVSCNRLIHYSLFSRTANTAIRYGFFNAIPPSL